MSELNRLRCRLRAVNIEYSALVRRKVGEAAYARMRELRTERRMLMALIAVVRHAAEMDRALVGLLAFGVVNIITGLVP